MKTPPHKRIDAAERKYKKAIAVFLKDSVFTSEYSYREYIIRKQCLELTTYFHFEGKKYRFDYEMDLCKKFPSVAEVRKILWESLGEAHRNVTSNTVRANIIKPLQYTHK